MTCDVTYSSSHSCGGCFVDLVGESFEEDDESDEDEVGANDGCCCVELFVAMVLL